VARLGGDEFVVLLDNPASLDDVVNVAVRIIQEVNVPVLLGEQTAQVGTSIGIAQFQNALETPAEALLKLADDAMYRSKAAGKNTYTFAD
jgi:diguanylate cyclase (GGDEF)-like protein